jgi:DNA-binding transcriptional LysR family regulator
MELDELKVFLTVARERSFSRAAERLCRTQPAVSQAVRRLEDRLNERLFDRRTKQATLTPAGEVLLREGARVMELVEQTTAAVRRQSEHERTIVRIGGEECGVHALMPAVAAFLEQHPHINVEFRRLREDEVIAAVTRGVIDIGIATADRIPSGFQQLRFSTPAARLVLLVPSEHRLARRREAAIEDLRNERLIVVSEPSHLYVRVTTLINGSGTRPGCLMGMVGLDSLKRAVDMRLGVGIVPAACASDIADGGSLVSVQLINGEYINPIRLVYRSTDAISKSAEALLNAAGGTPSRSLLGTVADAVRG